MSSDFFAAAHDAITAPPPGTPQRKKRAELPEALPEQATAADLCAWLTAALRLDHDPVAGAQQWGKHPTSPADVRLASGAVVRFDEAREIVKPQELATRVRSYTAGRAAPPLYSPADAQAIYGAVLRLCGEVADDAAAEEAADWVSQFLARHHVISCDLSTPEGRWRALSQLQAAQYDPTVLIDSDVNSPPVLVDEVSGRRFIRSRDFATFVRRRLCVTASGPRLRGEMLRAGYPSREFQQWRPGAERRGGESRIRLHVYELTEPDEPRTPVPACTPINTRAPAHAHARSEGGTQGYGGTNGDADLGWDVLDSFPDGASITLAEYEARRAEMRGGAA